MRWQTHTNLFELHKIQESYVFFISGERERERERERKREREFLKEPDCSE